MLCHNRRDSGTGYGRRSFKGDGAMRFGLQIDTYADAGDRNHYDAMRAVALEAERLGFESVWYEDHFMWRDDVYPDKPSPRLECLLTLAALAAETRRVQLG